MAFEQERALARARELAARWDCRPDGEVRFTSRSLLWPLARGDEALMLKLVDPDDDEAGAAAMLRLYDGEGAVRLVESEGNVLLLERVVAPAGQPGLEAMVLAGADDAATRAICAVVERLHRAAAARPPPDGLIPFRSRADELRRHLKEGRLAGEDRALARNAIEFGGALMAEPGLTVLALHGDVHHCNVRGSATRGWLAIDPKGVLGPRGYEYANTLCNPCPHTGLVAAPDRMARQAAIIAELAGLDRPTLLRFALLHAMQAAAWSPSAPDREHWLACARTAARLAGG